jgi:hypothetical protein
MQVSPGPSTPIWPPKTSTARSPRDHGTRLHQSRDVPPSECGIEYRLGCRGDQEADAGRNLPIFDDPRRLRQVFQGAAGARPDAAPDRLRFTSYINGRLRGEGTTLISGT